MGALNAGGFREIGLVTDSRRPASRRVRPRRIGRVRRPCAGRFTHPRRSMPGSSLWVAFGGALFRDSPETEFEVTGVTILSVGVRGPDDRGGADAGGAGDARRPAAGGGGPAPEAPAPEEAPPPVEQPEEAPEPEPDPEPEPPAPAPRGRGDRPDRGAADASGAPDLPPDDTPTPDEAPRIAPCPRLRRSRTSKPRPTFWISR
jgi:hypothetical protein